MATRYFKKASPRTKVVLPGLGTIEFDSIDNFTGYFKTGNEAIIEHFLDCMRKNRYGISEVSAEEYEEWAKKKASSSPLKPLLREEVGQSGVTGRVANAAETVVARAAVGKEVPAVNRQASAAAPQAAVVEVAPPGTARAPVKPEFNPPTGKRKPKVIA